jgi:hypothetical protein
LVIPRLQSGDNVIPQIVNIIKNVKGWGAFSTFISPKISCFLKNNLSLGIGGAPSQKLYLEKGMVDNFLNGGDGFPRVKLLKISRLFDNNLSPGVGGAPSQKLYLKNGTVENSLNGRDGFPRVKLPKISRLFDNNLSPGVGGAPSQKLYLKNSAVEIFLDSAVAFGRSKLAKISRLFDKSLSPGVGAAHGFWLPGRLKVGPHVHWDPHTSDVPQSQAPRACKLAGDHNKHGRPQCGCTWGPKSRT